MSLERISISDAGKHAGETVEIAGWLYNLRSGGKICFPQVRDGSGIMQCVALKSDPYPITPKEHGIDFLMDHRHLWLRSRRQHAALLVRHEVIKAIRDYFDSRGFVLVDTPIFTPAACEGTTTLFEVNYFEDEKAYLAQSGQLY